MISHVSSPLLHSLAVAEKRGAFKAWTLLLAIAAFSLSLLGTFLVRSGVLTSVHAFATDPARGIFILGFLGFVVDWEHRFADDAPLYVHCATGVRAAASAALLAREGHAVVHVDGAGVEPGQFCGGEDVTLQIRPQHQTRRPAQ